MIILQSELLRMMFFFYPIVRMMVMIWYH